MLDVPTNRGMCCHVGGDIDFDAAGNLYLSTGDDSNPFDSDGYTPIDERTNRNPAYDAQRSAGNTNDLRGKVLRIKVNANGTYSIPAGNLFPPGTAGTRPEIYAMGFRNPFRLSVDKATGAVYLGDYGPDAGTASATRGPGGQVEFNRITSRRQLRLALLHRLEHHRRDLRGLHVPVRAVREPVQLRRAGQQLPPQHRADATCRPRARRGSSTTTARWPRSAAARSRRWAARCTATTRPTRSTVKFPAALDGHYFAAEFGRRWIKTIDVNADGIGRADQRLPVARHADHRQRLRPGRRAVRAGLRHRLVRRRRQLRAVPHRVQPGRQPGAGRPGQRRPHVRHSRR